jgi:hypothetical protein
MRYKSGGYEVMIQCVGSVSATCESFERALLKKMLERRVQQKVHLKQGIEGALLSDA